MGMEATQNNVSTARNWLLNMGNAAKALDLTIQVNNNNSLFRIIQIIDCILVLHAITITRAPVC